MIILILSHVREKRVSKGGGSMKIVNRSGFVGYVLVLGLLLVAVGTSGCILLVGAAGGVAGSTYVGGKLDAEMNAPVEKVHQATVAGLKSLGLPLVTNQGDKLAAKLESRTVEDKKVAIAVSFVSETQSKLSIRVGIIGDEKRSRSILNAIQAELKEGG